MFSANGIDAQWYYRTDCGVTKIYKCTTYQQDCLLEKATKLYDVCKKGTKIISYAAVGGIGLVAFTALIGNDAATWIALGAGFVVLTVGIPQLIWTIPAWIIGSTRVRQIKNLMYFGTLESKTIQVAPTISINQVNSNPYFGMILSFNF